MKYDDFDDSGDLDGGDGEIGGDSDFDSDE